MSTECYLRPPEVTLCPYFKLQNLNLFSPNNNDYRPVLKCCHFMVSRSYSLVYDLVQLNCEIGAVAVVILLLCDVSPPG